MSDKVIQGNQVPITMSLKRGTSVVSDLASATNIRFVLEKDGGSSFGVDLAGIPSSAKIILNSPKVGDVTITPDSDDMEIDLGVYDIALLVTFSATQKEQFIAKRAIEVEAKVIS